MKRTYPIQRQGGFIICTATHPDWPNYDDRARSRVRHLFDGSGDKYAFPATLCGMLAVEFAQEVMDPVRQICGPCTKAASKCHPATGSEEKK